MWENFMFLYNTEQTWEKVWEMQSNNLEKKIPA